MDKKYWITKSNTLINSSYDLSLEEQRIILTLASMVQPEDEDFKPYIFKIHEFMALLNIKNKNKYVEIPKITKNLMQKVFELKQGNKILQLAWLSSAEYEKGSGVVELEFSPKLKPFMLGLKEFYTTYKLENVLELKSKYSIRMYEILKSNQFKKSFEINLEDLKYILKADKYKTYQHFSERVIMQSQKELSKKTDISFEFEKIPTGRKVTSIKFTIKNNKNEIAAGAVAAEPQQKQDLIKQVQAIFTKHDITEHEATCLLKDSKNNIELIKKCYDYAINKNVDNIIGYMRELLKGFNEPKENTKTTTFDNFKQRKYDTKDIKEIEKGLLGL